MNALLRGVLGGGGATLEVEIGTAIMGGRGMDAPVWKPRMSAALMVFRASVVGVGVNDWGWAVAGGVEVRIVAISSAARVAPSNAPSTLDRGEEGGGEEEGDVERQKAHLLANEGDETGLTDPEIPPLN